MCAMSQKLLRPKATGAPAPPPPSTNTIIRTISGNQLTTISGDKLRTVQNG